MKNTFSSNLQKLFICFTVVMTLVFGGCHKDNLLSTQLGKDETVFKQQTPTIKVDDVKHWFDKQEKSYSSLTNSSDSLQILSGATPVWQDAVNSFSQRGNEFLVAPLNIVGDKGGTRLLVTRDSANNLVGTFMIYVADEDYHRSTNGHYRLSDFNGNVIYLDVTGRFRFGYKIQNGQIIGASFASKTDGRNNISARTTCTVTTTTLCLNPPPVAFTFQPPGSCLYVMTITSTDCPPPPSSGSGMGSTGAGTGTGGGGWSGGQPASLFSDSQLSLLRIEYINSLGITDEEWNFLKDFPETLNAFNNYLTAKGRNQDNARAIKAYLPDFYGDVNLGVNHFESLKNDNGYYSRNKNAEFPKIGTPAWANTLRFADEVPNAAEAALVLAFPAQAVIIQMNSTIAVNETIRRYGHSGADDISDAFRHSYWNALNQSDVPLVAKLFADAHESAVNLTNPAQVLSRDMDFWNNDQGRTIGNNSSNASDEDLSLLVFGAILNGSMKRICRGNLIFTNQVC